MRVEEMTPRQAYEVGYEDGESNLIADVSTLCDQLDIDVEGHPFEAIRKEVEGLRRAAGAVALDDPRLIETLARVIENRHGTLHGIGSTLREALAELKRGR